MSFSTSKSDTDAQLAALLAELADQQEHGLTPDIEAVARQHPVLAGIAIAVGHRAICRRVREKSLDASTHITPSAWADYSRSLPRSFGDFELLRRVRRRRHGGRLQGARKKV